MAIPTQGDINSAVNGAVDKVRTAVTATAERAGNAAEFFQEQVGHFASAVDERTQRLAGNVTKAVSSLKSTAAEAVSGASQRADQLVGQAGAGMQSIATQLDSHAPENSTARSVAHAVSDSVRQAGTYLEESKLSGAADDVVGLIRRYPLPAVAIAAGLGWYMARQTRKV